jgi:hypothetical protein
VEVQIRKFLSPFHLISGKQLNNLADDLVCSAIIKNYCCYIKTYNPVNYTELKILVIRKILLILQFSSSLITLYMFKVDMDKIILTANLF